MTDKSVYLVDRTAQADLIGYLKSPTSGRLQTFVMGFERQLVADQRIQRAVELAAGGFGRALLFERPGGGIARIGERRLPDVFPLPVQSFERAERHQHLAANFEKGRVIVPGKPQRHGADRPYVRRHVVAARPVAARHGLRQATVLISQADRRAVEFQLAYVFHRFHLLADANIEFVQLVERIGIRQRQHRITVFHGAKLIGRIAADAMRRRIGIVELRVGFFELLQLA